MDIVSQGHLVVGHFGPQKMLKYLWHWYWWPKMHNDMGRYCSLCEQCMQSKPSNHKPAGKLHSLLLPTKFWDSIGMDFVSPFPESKGYNYL